MAPFYPPGYAYGGRESNFPPLGKLKNVKTEPPLVLVLFWFSVGCFFAFFEIFSGDLGL